MAETRWPHLTQAMHDAAAYVQQHWMTVASQTLASAGERDAYLQGLQAADSIRVTTGADSLHAVVTNVAPMARRIEEGQAPFHLPSRIDWSQHTHASGRAYLIVPFRHYTAQRGSRAAAASPQARRQMLPRRLSEAAVRLRPGQSLTLPGLPPYVPRTARNIRPGYTHAPMHVPLYREESGRRTRYLTFRTLTPDSPGWWIPGRPPQRLAAQTVRETEPEVRRMLGVAAQADVVQAIQIAMHVGSV